MNYCDFVAAIPPQQFSFDRIYHDQEYGFPVRQDTDLFERLVLEINQAGLSWSLILRKRAGFRRAYAGFDIARVAAFDEADVARLLQDSNIIRNRLKINAAIYNAGQVVQLQQQFGSFRQWLERLHPLSLPEWTRCFKQQFKFMGSEIVREFLMSTGYLRGAHAEYCPVYTRILAEHPPWLLRSEQAGE